jgi:putative phosphoesterase
MLVVIVADIHDNEVNLEKCLAWAKSKKAGQLICCGDVTNSHTLGLLAKWFDGPIHLIRGNMEIYESKEVKKFSNIKYYGRMGWFEIKGHKVGICHEPYFLPKILEKEVEYVFYGHTHKPWIEGKNGVIIANPGTLGGVFQRASFAVWHTETGKLELKLLNEIKN